MKSLTFIFLILGMSNFAHSQFTVIPTGTASPITDLALQGDTLIIVGTDNYFAKSYDNGNSITQFSTPGQIGYTNFDFQIIRNDYYLLSIQGFPYEHNQILKSIDFGVTWTTLYDTIGLFYSLTMLDSNFGVMGGTYGSYAMTQGSDTAWSLDTLYSTIIASESYGDSTMILISTGGASFISGNRGQSWNWGYCPSILHKAIQFISEDTVYSIGHDSEVNPKGVFAYSYNGGYNFSSTLIGYNNDYNTYDYKSAIRDFYFENSKDGFLVGHTIGGGTIFQTKDFGQTFTPYLSGFNNEFYSIINVNDSIAFIGGSNGLLLKWNKNIPLSTILSIDEKNNLSNIKVFPNPFSESTTFKFKNNILPLTLKIYNVFGQLVRVETINSNSYLFKRDNLKSGMYYFSINNYTGKISITN